MAHNFDGKPSEPEAQRMGWGTKMARKQGYRKRFWIGNENSLYMEAHLWMCKGRVLQTAGAAAAVLRELKHVQMLSLWFLLVYTFAGSELQQCTGWVGNISCKLFLFIFHQTLTDFHDSYTSAFGWKFVSIEYPTTPYMRRCTTLWNMKYDICVVLVVLVVSWVVVVVVVVVVWVVVVVAIQAWDSSSSCCWCRRVTSTGTPTTATWSWSRQWCWWTNWSISSRRSLDHRMRSPLGHWVGSAGQWMRSPGHWVVSMLGRRGAVSPTTFDVSAARKFHSSCVATSTHCLTLVGLHLWLFSGVTTNSGARWQNIPAGLSVFLPYSPLV